MHFCVCFCTLVSWDKKSKETGFALWLPDMHRVSIDYVPILAFPGGQGNVNIRRNSLIYITRGKDRSICSSGKVLGNHPSPPSILSTNGRGIASYFFAVSYSCHEQVPYLYTQTISMRSPGWVNGSQETWSQLNHTPSSGISHESSNKISAMFVFNGSSLDTGENC